MNTEEMQAMTRLLKKLSALRATLSADERALLDEFIVAPGADDVAAHILKEAATPAVTPAATPQPDEVAAHIFKEAATPVVTPVALPKPHPRFDVIYDSVKEIYRIA